jgi:alpha-glucoside transport system permease protein
MSNIEAAQIGTETAEAEAPTRRKAPPHVDPNPAKAGWATKLALGIICLLWMIPVIGTLITSFRTESAANSSGWWRVLGNPALTTQNYKTAWVDGQMGTQFLNSFAITLPAVFVPLLIAAFAAYSFTFMEFPARNFLFLLIVGLLVIPNYVAFGPVLNLYGKVGLGGTIPAVWLAHIGFGMPLAIYILRNYMATLPKTVIESAKIDGATHFQTFFRLVLPMSVPALASFAIFQFLWVWNDLFVALVFVGPGDNAPVTVGLNNLVGQQGNGWNFLSAGSFISMIVPLAIFLGLQRFFVRGMTAGAVKG